MVALLLLSFRCLVTVNVLWLFLAVPWICLQCVIVVFPGQTFLLCVQMLSYIGPSSLVLVCFAYKVCSVDSACNGPITFGLGLLH